MIKHSKYHEIDSAIIYGFAVLSVLILSNIEKPLFRMIHTVSPLSVEQKIETSLFKKEAFSNIKIKGKAYIVYDIVDQKIIAEKNAHTALPLASITKVMTAITARTHYDGKKMITINPKSIDGRYDFGLKGGQSWKLNELLKYTLTISSNDGAQAIADELGGRNAFIAQMNTDAAALGLVLHFTHPAGLDENGKYGGKGSALEVAKLVQIARRQFPELFDVTTKRRTNVSASTGKIYGVPNTNQQVSNLSGIEFSKTGFTDDAGGNLVVIVDIVVGHPVAIVVLGSTHEERFTDVEMLYSALQKSVKK